MRYPTNSFGDHMRTRARELRQQMSPPERALWQLLRDSRLQGLKFRRQVAIGPYVADFFCHAKQLVVELDGESHDYRGADDVQRQEFLQREQLTVLRFANHDVVHDPEAVLLAILKTVGTDIQPLL